MHLVLALHGTLTVRHEEEPAGAMAGVLTAPDVAHSIDARGREVLLVFLERESAVGTALLAALALPRSIRPITARERDQIALMLLQ